MTNKRDIGEAKKPEKGRKKPENAPPPPSSSSSASPPPSSSSSASPPPASPPPASPPPASPPPAVVTAAGVEAIPAGTLPGRVPTAAPAAAPRGRPRKTTEDRRRDAAAAAAEREKRAAAAAAAREAQVNANVEVCVLLLSSLTTYAPPPLSEAERAMLAAGLRPAIERYDGELPPWATAALALAAVFGPRIAAAALRSRQRRLHLVRPAGPEPTEQG